MPWVFATVALLLAVLVPGFRRVVLWVAGLGGAAVFLIWIYWQVQEADNTRRQERAKRLIPIADVEVLDASMETESSYATLTGRVKNMNSRHTLKAVELRIRILDCERKEKPHCETVGESTTRLVVSVPPGQVRALDDHVSFSDLGPPPSDMTRTWTFEFVSVEGE